MMNKAMLMLKNLEKSKKTVENFFFKNNLGLLFSTRKKSLATLKADCFELKTQIKFQHQNQQQNQQKKQLNRRNLNQNCNKNL